MRDDDPRPHRRQRDRDEVPEARPTRKGRGPLIAVLAGVGLLVLVGAGLGAYLLFAGGSGKSAEDKVRPPRGLQTDMFAYVPASAFSASYVDLGLARELGDQEYHMAIDGVFPNRAHLPDGLRFVCETRAMGKRPFGQYLLSYAAPVDFPALAKELKLEPLTGNLSRVYVGKFESNAWTIFQPTPTKLWVSCYSSRNSTRQPGDQELADLLARDPSSCPLSPDLIAGLTEVSGYPNLKFRRYSTEKPPYTHFEGVLFNSQNVREAHNLWRFGS